MNKSPAFQFYAADYLADERVQLMTLEEEGAYIRLLATCWREGSIPSDEIKLSRLCKGANTTVVRVVAECFYQSPTDPLRLLHKRLEAEREKQREWKSKSSEGGKKSAGLRAAKRVNNRNDKVSGQDILVEDASRVVEPPYQPKGNSSSLSSSLSLVKQQHTSPSAPSEDVSQSANLFVEAYNSNRGVLAKAIELSDGRRAKLASRRKKGLTVERFIEAVKLAVRTPFLRGEGPRGWRCDFDWLIQNDTHLLNIFEEKYGVPDKPKTVFVEASPEEWRGGVALA